MVRVHEMDIPSHVTARLSFASASILDIPITGAVKDCCCCIAIFDLRDLLLRYYLSSRPLGVTDVFQRRRRVVIDTFA